MDGTSYCIVGGNFTGQWYDYYERALSCIEGGCYEAALSDLDDAIRRREKDQRRARTYGDHYVEYFPNREKGLIYFFQGRYDQAKSELEKSLEHFPSEKAYYYLDEVRKGIFARAEQPPSIPLLTVISPKPLPGDTEIWTAHDPVIISGIASDKKQFISEIIIGEKSVFFEQSDREIRFSEKLHLDEPSKLET